MKTHHETLRVVGCPARKQSHKWTWDGEDIKAFSIAATYQRKTMTHDSNDHDFDSPDKNSTSTPHYTSDRGRPETARAQAAGVLQKLYDDAEEARRKYNQHVGDDDEAPAIEEFTPDEHAVDAQAAYWAGVHAISGGRGHLLQLALTTNGPALTADLDTVLSTDDGTFDELEEP